LLKIFALSFSVFSKSNYRVVNAHTSLFIKIDNPKRHFSNKIKMYTNAAEMVEALS
jgi:hypothetical protein